MGQDWADGIRTVTKSGMRNGVMKKTDGDLRPFTVDGKADPSPESSAVGRDLPAWRCKGHFYYPLGLYFRETFGEPVRKVSVDAGFSCPNVDGTVGTGGCVFCDNRSFSPSRRLGLPEIEDQIAEGIRRISARYKTRKFIAYFQPSTNTYAPPERLAVLYRRALAHPSVVGIAIGTRPDALPDTVLDVIAELANETWLSLEIGLQTAKDETLRFLHRGHDFASFADAVARAQKRGIRLGTHLILGLPGETDDDLLRTVRLTAAMNLHSVKLHNLYDEKNTPLAELYVKGAVTLPTCTDYARMVVDVLERFSPTTVIERIAGDAPVDFLIAPPWSGEKSTVRSGVEAEFRRRRTWQGRIFGADDPLG